MGNVNHPRYNSLRKETKIPRSKRVRNEGFFLRYYKESIIRLEFVTYADRKISIFRSLISIRQFRQAKFPI